MATRAIVVVLAQLASAVLVQSALAQEYLYATGAGEVTGFRSDPVTGAVTALPGMPLHLDWAYSLAGDPARRSLYVTGFNGTLTRLSVDPATGGLAFTDSISTPGYPERAVAVHPRLPVVYAADPLFERVHVYDVSQSCCIAHLGAVAAGNNVDFVAVDPSGRFVYATTSFEDVGGADGSRVWGYAVDQVTGLLTPLPGSPWLEGFNKRTGDVVVDPSGRYLYAVNLLADEVTGYLIDGVSGGLTRMPGAPFPTGGTLPGHLRTTDSGQFLYVSNGGSGTVSGFRIEADGSLTLLPGSPFTAGQPDGMAIAGGGRFAYVAATLDNTLWGFRVDPASGVLTPLAGQPFPGGTTPQNLAVVRFESIGPQPTLSADDMSVTEGDAGTTNAVFTVQLANPPPNNVAVDYATVPGTASAPADFAATSGTVTFPPGVSTRQVVVPVNGDVVDEPDEFFSLVLSGPIGGVLGDAEAVARIRDDDGASLRVLALDRNADLGADLQAQAGPVADVDLYLLQRPPWSSYEVVVEGGSGDFGGAGPEVDLVSGDLSTLVASSPIGTGSARTLRLENNLPTTRLEYVRVRSGGCTTDCGPDDAYRIHVRETTGRIARFNESAGQRTVLVLQNRGDVGMSVHASYWGPSGARLGGVTVSLAPRASAVVATPVAAQGASGSITVSHDGSLGALAGKAVALDPVNGLSFDTPLTTAER